MKHVIPFTKMQGAGNDYIYVNTLLYSVPDPAETARQWSRPHTGIGSDGLVLIGFADNEEADYQMRIFNADGSEAMMCGNASRCIGKYLYEKGITDKTRIRLQTCSGVKMLQLHLPTDDTGTAHTACQPGHGTGKRRAVESVTVDMLSPRFYVPEQYASTGQPDASFCRMPGTDFPSFGKRETANGETAERWEVGADGARLTVDGRVFEGTFVSMGNPHFVIFTDDVEHFPLDVWGPRLEHHKAFPERCNVEIAQRQADGSIRMRVWERGSGITQACGTGACATAVAAALTGRGGRQSRIVMDGGVLDVTWSEQNGHVLMRGGAEFVFEGEAALPETH